jgi:hypothetical protein
MSRFIVYFFTLLISCCEAQTPALLSFLSGGGTEAPIPAVPSIFYNTTITVADGAVKTFVYQPYDIDNPPVGGWPVIIWYSGDGADNNNGAQVTGASTTNSDPTYTLSPTISGRLMATSVKVKVNGVIVGSGQLGGTITGTGITSGSFSVTSGTPTISVTFGSSQSGNTITFDYYHSTMFIEGVPLAINRGDTLDGRAIWIAPMNFDNDQYHNMDYFDKVVEWAYNEYDINVKRISATGLSRGAIFCIDRSEESASTSIFKSRSKFWIKTNGSGLGSIVTTDPSDADYTETGIASIATIAGTTAGTYTWTNNKVGIAIVHGTNDGVVPNAIVSFTNITDETTPIETPQVLNLWNVGHNGTAWNTNFAYRKYANSTAIDDAPWDWVDFVLKYSYDDLEAATLHVEQAEKRRLGTEEDIIDYRKALRRVNLLGASAEKTALLDRLATLLPLIEGTGGTRWVLNHHNFGNNESSPYNNRQAHTVSVGPSNMITWPSAGSSGLDFEVIANTTNTLNNVGGRTYFIGGLSRLAQKSGVVLNSGTQTFGFNDVPSGTYIVRFYHTAQVSTNAGGQAAISVTLNSETKTQYSGINNMLGYIQFTGVPHTALDSFTVTRAFTTDTFWVITELYLQP